MAKLHIERTIEVARTPADVFRYLADFSTCEQWDPTVRRATKLTPGAPCPGSEFDVAIAAGPRTIPMRYRLVDALPDRRLHLEGSGDGFTAIDRIEVAPSGAGTQVRYCAELNLRWAPKALAPVLRSWGDRLGDRSMEGLHRALAEDGPRPPSAARRWADRLLLPAATRFTVAGYRAMPSRGLSRFVHGQRIGITGATRGLGLAAAQLLARLGASLVLVGRDGESLDRARACIEDFAGPTPIESLAADLSRLAECRRVADVLAQSPLPLHAWINNAGALFSTREETSEGLERSLAINLLAPWMLSQRLAPKLAESHGRMINVVSGGLYLQGVDVEDLGYRYREYDGSKAYAQAKRALMILTRHGAKAEPRIAWHAMHPGWADTPGVRKSLPTFQRLLRPVLRDARMGADTMAWLASHPELGPGRSGQLWFDRALHAEAVLPGTAPSESQERTLIERVNELLHLRANR